MTDSATIRPFDLREAGWVRGGKYDLSQEAASVFWFLHAHGIWERGHLWFGCVDIRMTSDEIIQVSTILSEGSVRRGLAELEEKQFIIRLRRFNRWDEPLNDSIQFTMPADWCRSCATRKRGEHACPDPGPCLCGLGREEEMNDVLLSMADSPMRPAIRD